MQEIKDSSNNVVPMENEFYIMSQKYFLFDSDVEVDFGLIAGVGGAAVVVKINGDKVAKIEKMKITGDKMEAEEWAKRAEFITIKEIVERMECCYKECSMILQPEKVFVQKIGGKWYLVTGKVYNIV